MTETKTERINNNSHTTYCGELSVEDFNTNSPNKKRIRLMADSLKNNEKEKELAMYSKYTQEELREMRLISNTNGRPVHNLTDEKWQKEFLLRKMFVTPHNKNVMKLQGKYSIEGGSYNEESEKIYDGCTNWQQYCRFINDILSNIRSGQVDYCYYIHQIEDLLKFHYTSLKTKYYDGYWAVWLEK